MDGNKMIQFMNYLQNEGIDLRRFQQIVCGIVLQVLFRAIRVLAHCDSWVKQELLQMPEGYLFPKFMTRRILKEVPEKQLPTLAVYLRLIPGV